ncbi:PAAR-like protein [Aquimarina sp. MMG016]|uniref:PAAR-like protein n=1 Tax=Aquimarina sp. MMG016 TaxID=2822690 RepID=UPI001B3A6B3E|nr:PAAR-like protein [Aquimarina sp. MMG016]MBQ4820625.1 DUF4280 domain-containing protein [Aquimarina sp. MMG016]
MSRQFVPSGTLITCSIASGETTEITATNSTITIYGENWLTTNDNVPNANFKPFPSCSSKCKVPCAIIKGEWETPASDKILSKGKKLLADDSTLTCDKGGKISLVMQCVGDMVDPPNTFDKLKESLNGTFKTVVKKVEAIQAGVAGSIATTVGDIAAPVTAVINNEAVQSALQTGQEYLAKAQELKNTVDEHIETAGDSTETLSEYIEQEVGGREAIATDLVYDVTDGLQQELDDLLNNVEDAINQNLDEIRNGINVAGTNPQSNPLLDILSGIRDAGTVLTENPENAPFQVNANSDSSIFDTHSVTTRAPHQTTSLSDRIDGLTNQLSAQTQEIRDELSSEIADLEALIERYSLNNYLQQKIDDELDRRIKKAEKESAELQTDMDRASTLLSGLGNEYNDFVTGFSDQIIAKFNSEVDPRLVEAQEKLKTANANLSTAATGLNGAKFIAGGLPAGLVVTKAKPKKKKGDKEGVGNGTGAALSLVEGPSSSSSSSETSKLKLTKITFDTKYDVCSDDAENFDDIYVLEDEDGYYHYMLDRSIPDNAITKKPKNIPIMFSSRDIISFTATIELEDPSDPLAKTPDIRVIDKSGAYLFNIVKGATNSKFAIIVSSTNVPYAGTVEYFKDFELVFEYSEDGVNWINLGQSVNRLYITLKNPEYSKALPDFQFTDAKNKRSIPIITESLLWWGCKQAKGLDDEELILDEVFKLFETKKVLRAREGTSYLRTNLNTKGLGYWRNRTSFIGTKPKYPLIMPLPRGRGLGELLRDGEGRCGEFSLLLTAIMLAQGITSVSPYAFKTSQFTSLNPNQWPSYNENLDNNIPKTFFPTVFLVKGWKTNDPKAPKEISTSGNKAQGNSFPLHFFWDHVYTVFRKGSKIKYYDPSYGIKGNTYFSSEREVLAQYAKDAIEGVVLVKLSQNAIDGEPFYDKQHSKLFFNLFNPVKAYRRKDDAPKYIYKVEKKNMSKYLEKNTL